MSGNVAWGTPWLELSDRATGGGLRPTARGMPGSSSRTLSGPTLPARLLDLRRPPPRVQLLGELPRGLGVAIVGTREPTKPAKDFAFRLAAAFARAGVAVLSGGALGIDFAAHLGALRAGGTTVVVAPAGFTACYPNEHSELFRRVLARGGAYVSLVDDDVPATKWSFFPRNACLAALSHAVVVVEAPLRSGARNAAQWARKLGRPLFAVPTVPWNERGRGCLDELQRGARLCLRAEDVLRELERLEALPAQSLSGSNRPRRSRQIELDFSHHAAERRELEAVVCAVEAGAVHLDAVCEHSGLPAATAQRHLLTLTLEGVLAPDPAGGVGSLTSHPPLSFPKSIK